MSKLSQLENFRKWNIPTPSFAGYSHEDHQNGLPPPRNLQFPLAVRSSFEGEDGHGRSHAGQFRTVLNVSREKLDEALTTVFEAYPEKSGSVVILQEMVQAAFSGVLFAFRKGIWMMEIGEGLGEQVVGGQTTPDRIVVPKFNRSDRLMSHLYTFWALPAPYNKLYKPLVALSAYAQALLDHDQEAKHGLDIEFAIAGGRVFLLQARPITTPEEREEMLTTANHREILPPRPSRLMTAVVSSAGYALFEYYRQLDPGLGKRSFIIEAEGMPWINLSALLDMVVSWGLPTHLIGNSIGAEDLYRVQLRPHLAIQKAGVFLKTLSHQWSAQRVIKKWLRSLPGEADQKEKARKELWENDRRAAFEEWLKDFRQLYIDLVRHMQLLTGAMSGPLSILDRLGLLPGMAAALQRKSRSTDYFHAFREWRNGKRTRSDFLAQYGHRGFYESDIGMPRFYEYTDEGWEQLMRAEQEQAIEAPAEAPKESFWSFLWTPLFKAVHLREMVRHEVMKYFWRYRRELLQHFDPLEQKEGVPWQFLPSDLLSYLGDHRSLSDLVAISYPEPSGWDMNTFLCNDNGRRTPPPALYVSREKQDGIPKGIGIYPGKVRGQVWRVGEASLTNLKRPPFPTVILVTDALDPGWIPYFSKVDGVLAYVGGLLSHASIILRESRLPSITQIPAYLELQTGDWVEMDGKTGLIEKVEARNGERQRIR